MESRCGCARLSVSITAGTMTNSPISSPTSPTDLGLLLRRYRREAGLTQEELAHRAGISARAVSDIERGLRASIYRDTADRLSRALGLNEPERGRLLRAARREHHAIETRGAPNASAGSSPQTSRAPMLGRARELRIIEVAVGSALAGSGQLVLISGEAGIGKTRLLDETARLATRRGLRVVWGRWLEAEGMPAYWAWREALRPMEVIEPAAAALTTAEREAAARVLPDLPWRRPTQRAASAASVDERFAAFEAIMRLLVGATAARGLAVLLDDLHWADAPSFRLLEHVSQVVAPARLLLLASYRDPDRNRLRQTLGELARTEPVRIELRGLDQEECEQCLTALSGGPVPAALAERIRKRTGGNPFFVTEYGRLLADRAAPGSDALGAVPPGARDVVARRLERLAPGSRRALEAAAVGGSVLRPGVLAQVLETDQPLILSAIQEAAAESLLARDGDSDAPYRFAHDLVRDAVYGELPNIQRLELHRRTAEQLERLVGVDADVHPSEVAHHWLQALAGGHGAHAAGAAHRAADVAMAQLAFEDAARLYGVAAELVATAGSRPGR